jgi:hypothetical protein
VRFSNLFDTIIAQNKDGCKYEKGDTATKIPLAGRQAGFPILK